MVHCTLKLEPRYKLLFQSQVFHFSPAMTFNTIKCTCLWTKTVYLFGSTRTYFHAKTLPLACTQKSASTKQSAISHILVSLLLQSFLSSSADWIRLLGFPCSTQFDACHKCKRVHYSSKADVPCIICPFLLEILW